MSITDTINEIEKLWGDGQRASAQRALARVFDDVTALGAVERDRTLELVASRVNQPHPGLGANLALLGGALVEAGAPARPLALAIAEPLERAVAAALRFLELARDAPEPADGPGATYPVGERLLSQAAVDDIAARDRSAAASFFSLDTWYRPAVASWTRDVSALREAQTRPALLQALETLDTSCDGAHWLYLLVHAALDMRFVLLLPELEEAYSLVADGILDVGQLSVLLSPEIADSLARLGVTERAGDGIIRVMRGEGPQEDAAQFFGASFHLYPWRAVNPDTGMPEDDRFRWTAPGGRGSHSLPTDFLPTKVESVDGTRVLVLVGPNAEGGTRFTREISAVRTFEGLKANLRDVKKLSPLVTREWSKTVAEAVRARPNSSLH